MATLASAFDGHICRESTTLGADSPCSKPFKKKDSPLFVAVFVKHIWFQDNFHVEYIEKITRRS